MREILFRAKRIDDVEWEEGNYVYDYAHNAHFILKNQIICANCINDRRTDYSLCDYEIDPETLCQYTGLHDKNGKRIWENDIVKCNKRNDGFEFYKVIWRKEYAEFGVEPVEYGVQYPIGLDVYSDKYDDSVYGRHYEVVGNIFDNSELLRSV